MHIKRTRTRRQFNIGTSVLGYAEDDSDSAHRRLAKAGLPHKALLVFPR